MDTPFSDSDSDELPLVARFGLKAEAAGGRRGRGAAGPVTGQGPDGTDRWAPSGPAPAAGRPRRPIWPPARRPRGPPAPWPAPGRAVARLPCGPAGPRRRRSPRRAARLCAPRALRRATARRCAAHRAPPHPRSSPPPLPCPRPAGRVEPFESPSTSGSSGRNGGGGSDDDSAKPGCRAGSGAAGGSSSGGGKRPGPLKRSRAGGSGDGGGSSSDDDDPGGGGGGSTRRRSTSRASGSSSSSTSSSSDGSSSSTSSSSGSGSSESDSGSSDEGEGEDGGGSRRASGGSDDAASGRARPRKRRRTFFPRIGKAERCGHCHTCLNPQMKKACITRREEMAQGLERQQQKEQRKEERRAAKRQREEASGAAGKAAGGKPAAGKPPAAVAGERRKRPAPAPAAPSGTAAYIDILAPMVDADGALKPSGVPGLVASLPRFPTPRSRELVAILLERTREAELAAFMAAGGGDALAGWIADAKAAAAEGSKEAASLLKSVLAAAGRFPVSMAFLKASPLSKAVGGLRKHANAEVARAAQAAVDALFRRASGGGAPPAAGAAAARPAAAAAAGPAAAAAAAGGSVNGKAKEAGAAKKGAAADEQVVAPGGAREGRGWEGRARSSGRCMPAPWQRAAQPRGRHAAARCASRAVVAHAVHAARGAGPWARPRT
jgi:hypothetical protein